MNKLFTIAIGVFTIGSFGVANADTTEAGGQTFATAQVVDVNCVLTGGVSGDAAHIESGVVTTTGGAEQFITINGPAGAFFTLATTPNDGILGSGDGTCSQYSDNTFSTETFFDDDDGPGLYPMFYPAEVFADVSGDIYLGFGEFGADEEITYCYDILDVSLFTTFTDFFRVEGLAPGTMVTAEIQSDGETFGFFDSVLEAFDSAEVAIGFADDTGEGPNPYFETLTVAAPADGVIVFNVRPFGTQTGGTYQFEISDGSGDCLVGDLNGDGKVSLLDVSPFVDAITSGTFSCEADANKDGTVDLIDVAPFVDLLTS